MKAILGAIGGAVLATAILTTASATSAAAAPGNAVNGQRVFANQKCATCHPMNGIGVKIGPDLGAVGTRRDAAWLAKFLVNPTPLDPKNRPPVKMVAVKVKGQDLDDLIAYLLTLKGKK